MSYVYWKIERTPVLDDGTWDDGNKETLTQYYDPIVRVNTGDARDSFEFKVTNTSGDFDNYFTERDKITISRVVNSTSVASSDIILVGSIKSLPEEEANNKNLIRVEGYNFSEAVLSGITFIDASNVDIPTMFQNALNQVQAYNSNFGVTWASGNRSTKYKDGSAFPTVGERLFNKPLRQLFEKWSVKENTEDVNYYWYVNKDNELIWEPMTQDVASTFNSDTDAFRSLKISKDSSDVKNWLIVKGGVAPNGDPIQERVDDLASISKHGMKYHIITDIAKNAGSYTSKDLADQGVTSIADATFPFTTSWGVSATSYDNYITQLKTQVKAECRKVGEAFLNARKFGKLKVEISFEPGKGWALGEVISCTIPSLTKEGAVIEPKLLRVVDIQYTTTTDTFTLEEDEGTI